MSEERGAWRDKSPNLAGRTFHFGAGTMMYVLFGVACRSSCEPSDLRHKSRGTDLFSTAVGQAVLVGLGRHARVLLRWHAALGPGTTHVNKCLSRPACEST